MKFSSKLFWTSIAFIGLVCSPHAFAQDLTIDAAIELGAKVGIADAELCSNPLSTNCPSRPRYQLIRISGAQINVNQSWENWLEFWRQPNTTIDPQCYTSSGNMDCINSANQPIPATLRNRLPNGASNPVRDDQFGVPKTTINGVDYYINSCHFNPSATFFSDSVSTVNFFSGWLNANDFSNRYFNLDECSLSPDNIIEITQPFAEYSSKWVALESAAMQVVHTAEGVVVVGGLIFATDGAIAYLLGDTLAGTFLSSALNGTAQAAGDALLAKGIVQDLSNIGNCQSVSCRYDHIVSLGINAAFAFDTVSSRAKAQNFLDFTGDESSGAMLPQAELTSNEKDFYRWMMHAATDTRVAEIIDTYGEAGGAHLNVLGDLPEQWLGEEWFWDWYDDELANVNDNPSLNALTQKLRDTLDELDPEKGCGRRLVQRFGDCDGDSRHGTTGIWSETLLEADQELSCTGGFNPVSWSTQGNSDSGDSHTETDPGPPADTFALGNVVSYEAEDFIGSNKSGNHRRTTNQYYRGEGLLDYRGEGYVEWDINVSERGVYALNIGYALRSGQRALDLRVDGSYIGRLPFRATGSWTSIGVERVEDIVLNPGFHTVRLSTTGRSGPNIDFIDVQGTSTVVVEPQEFYFIFGSNITSVHPGFTGGGFLDFGGFQTGAIVDLIADRCGTYDVVYRYANGSGNRPVNVDVLRNLQSVDFLTYTFTGTGSWRTWRSRVGYRLTASEGDMITVILDAATSAGGPNLDHVALKWVSNTGCP